MTLQRDANLVVYEGQKAVWASGSTLTGMWAGSDDADRLEVTQTGGLVIYGPRQSVYWSTRTGGAFQGARLVLEDDGKLVVLNPDDTVEWSSDPGLEALRLIRDTRQWYRLTLQGRDLTVLDGSTELQTVSAIDSTRQHWRLTWAEDGALALSTRYLGAAFCLDVDADTGRPQLAPVGEKVGGYTGQRWSLSPTRLGGYKLHNQFRRDEALSAGADGVPTLVNRWGTGPELSWILAPIGPIAENREVPQLKKVVPDDLDANSEGPTDLTVNHDPTKPARAVMVFVDFSDAPAGDTDRKQIAARITGDGDAQQLFAQQSYGRFALDVTVRDDLGWKRMPKLAKIYREWWANADRYLLHREYIAAAGDLYREQVRFADYDVVLVVGPKEGNPFASASAFSHRQGRGATLTGGYEIRHAVTFDGEIYDETHTTLVHEMGHVLGLPDLYTTEGRDKVGRWSIMSDFRRDAFLGWHRHKCRWLPRDRATYLDGMVDDTFCLSPLNGPTGLSLLACRLDDQRMLVLEVADPGTDEVEGGVLAYTVNSAISSPNGPISVIPRATGGTDLVQAPYRAGDTLTHSDPSSGTVITAKVTTRLPSSDLTEPASYLVAVTYRPKPT